MTGTRVVSLTGPFDLAFLNAGVSTNLGAMSLDQPPIVALTDQAYRRIMGINVDGVVYGARAVYPGMADLGRGDIVVTASMAGLHPIALDPIYGLTKHAVVGLVRSLAAGIELFPDAPDVCVSAICPGFTDTNIVGPELRVMIEHRGLPIMPPEQVADVVLRSVRERVQGAQWIVWPGLEPKVYEWNHGVES
jgi:NAD(P)-dependent dehydrogenase (short-subunit alcohol dehydrogenase family)